LEKLRLFENLSRLNNERETNRSQFHKGLATLFPMIADQKSKI